MGVGSGLYMYDVIVKRLRSLSLLLMNSCTFVALTLLIEPAGRILKNFI